MTKQDPFLVQTIPILIRYILLILINIISIYNMFNTMFAIYNLFNQYFRHIDHPTAGSIQISGGWRLDQASAKGSQSAMKFEKK